ncbi:MAG: hypothetical protein V4567_04510 [Pseudomonadota bacterium]
MAAWLVFAAFLAAGLAGLAFFGVAFATFRATLAGALRAAFATGFFAGLAFLATGLAAFGLRFAARCFAFAMFPALDIVEMRPRVIA